MKKKSKKKEPQKNKLEKPKVESMPVNEEVKNDGKDDTYTWVG